MSKNYKGRWVLGKSLSWVDWSEFQPQGVLPLCPGGDEVHHWLLLVVLKWEVGEVHHCHLLGGPGKCRQTLIEKRSPPDCRYLSW